MTGPVSGKNLIDTMIQGGEKAVKDFAMVSGGEWLDKAPEYILTTYAGSHLKDIDNVSALFEVSVGETRREAGAVRRGRPAEHERLNGRIDVVVYWADGRPRGAIEVKSPIWTADKAKLRPDFVELSTALSANRTSSLQFCAFLFYASVAAPRKAHKDANDRLCALLDRIMVEAESVANECGSLSALLDTGKVHVLDEGAWCIAAVIFVHQGREQAFA